jgi:hypothetical protein
MAFKYLISLALHARSRPGGRQFRHFRHFIKTVEIDRRMKAFFAVDHKKPLRSHQVCAGLERKENVYEQPKAHTSSKHGSGKGEHLVSYVCRDRHSVNFHACNLTIFEVRQGVKSLQTARQ